MKKKVYPVLILLCLVCLLQGCVTSNAAQTTEKTTFLWKLEEKNAVLYFFGSIHMASQDLYPLDEKITTAFDQADTLVVELDATSKENLTRTQQLTIARGTFPGDETLADYAGPELLEHLSSLAGMYGIPPEAGLKLKPWVIEITITAMEIQKMGYDASLGLDIHFLNLAHERGKEIQELETVDEQIDLVSGIPVPDQILSLESTIRELEELPAYVDEMISAWREGDAEKMAEMIMKAYTVSPEFRTVYERLFTARNQKWVDTYCDFIAGGGTYFIITGAGHLVGENSVIDMLRARGYTPVQL